jgi:hypothetical protein
MVKRTYRDLFGISGKWLVLYLELFLKIRGVSLKIHGLRLDYIETKGPLCKMAGIFWF